MFTVNYIHQIITRLSNWKLTSCLLLSNQTHFDCRWKNSLCRQQNEEHDPLFSDFCVFVDVVRLLRTFSCSHFGQDVSWCWRQAGRCGRSCLAVLTVFPPSGHRAVYVGVHVPLGRQSRRRHHRRGHRHHRKRRDRSDREDGRESPTYGPSRLRRFLITHTLRYHVINLMKGLLYCRHAVSESPVHPRDRGRRRGAHLPRSVHRAGRDHLQRRRLPGVEGDGQVRMHSAPPLYSDCSWWNSDALILFSSSLCFCSWFKNYFYRN